MDYVGFRDLRVKERNPRPIHGHPHVFAIHSQQDTCEVAPLATATVGNRRSRLQLDLPTREPAIVVEPDQWPVQARRADLQAVASGKQFAVNIERSTQIATHGLAIRQGHAQARAMLAARSVNDDSQDHLPVLGQEGDEHQVDTVSGADRVYERLDALDVGSAFHFEV
jgi:hypothetical protein